MRELSREEHELILNLFIMAFMDWHMPISKNQYATFIDEWSLFNKLKDCFPMDEVCEQELFSNNRECYYKAINWIKEV